MAGSYMSAKNGKRPGKGKTAKTKAKAKSKKPVKGY